MDGQIGVFNDRGISLLLERGYIGVSDVKEYQATTDYVQPASMDVRLGREIGSAVAFGLEDIALCNGYRPATLGEDYVTFLPGHYTSAETYDLFGCHPSVHPRIALRSTPRRLGLEFGDVEPYKIGEGTLMADILNARKYPISVQKGTRLWQVLWHEHQMPMYEHRDATYKIFDRPAPPPMRLSTGRYIYDHDQINYLIKNGDIAFSEDVVLKDGIIRFHAGTMRTQYTQDHLVLHADGRKTDVHGNPIQTIKSEANVHHIEPGDFLDIQLKETMRLSERVGILIYYGSMNQTISPPVSFEEHHTRLMNTSMQGGWIDPGYQGKMSVQLMALRDTLTIHEGDFVAAGVIIHWPDGVNLPYGHKARNSQYQEKK